MILSKKSGELKLLIKKKLRMQNRSRLPISSFPAPPPRIFAGSVQEPLAKSSQAPIQDLSYRSPSSSQASPEGLAKQSTSSSQSSPQVLQALPLPALWHLLKSLQLLPHHFMGGPLLLL